MGDEGDTPAPAPAEPPAAAPDSVRVQFRNVTLLAVDTDFFTTDVPGAALPGDLLAEDNLLRAGIGVGGTGILAPLSADEIDLPCSDTLVVGTAGGKFLDADLGTLMGQGPVRFMQTGFQFDCGATLVFEYTETADSHTVTVSQAK